jgi:hypothetical protein
MRMAFKRIIKLIDYISGVINIAEILLLTWTQRVKWEYLTKLRLISSCCQNRMIHQVKTVR